MSIEDSVLPIEEVIRQLVENNQQRLEINKVIRELKKKSGYEDLLRKSLRLKDRLYQYMLDEDLSDFQGFKRSGCAPNQVRKEERLMKKTEAIEEKLEEVFEQPEVDLASLALELAKV
jgi:hypothetical protein